MYHISLPKLREDYKLLRKRNPEVANQVLALIEFEKIKLATKNDPSKSGKRMKVSALCNGVGISLRTLQRWHRNYRIGEIFKLAKSKANGATRKDITEEAKYIITLMRKDYLWGAEVIQAHLEIDHKIKLTQYMINRYLDESGLKLEYPCLPVRKNKNKKKHTKVVKVNTPGEHTQMDVNHQRHILDHKSYIYNFVDHASNLSDPLYKEDSFLTNFRV